MTGIQAMSMPSLWQEPYLVISDRCFLVALGSSAVHLTSCVRTKLRGEILSKGQQTIAHRPVGLVLLFVLKLKINFNCGKTHMTWNSPSSPFLSVEFSSVRHIHVVGQPTSRTFHLAKRKLCLSPSYFVWISQLHRNESSSLAIPMMSCAGERSELLWLPFSLLNYLWRGM